MSFDPHRDIDASSRHAELRVAETQRPATGDEGSQQQAWVLVDLGSSNGTYVEGHRVTETAVTRNVPIAVEFGPGGPRIRLFVGDETAIENLPPAPVEKSQPRWLVPTIAGAIALLLVVLLLLKC